MDLRLLLVSHATTAAQRTGRFPTTAGDPVGDTLDARAIAETEAARGRLALPGAAAALTSPAACARETASALGLAAVVDRGLVDMNYGRWHGRKLSEIAGESGQDLVTWTRDPDAAPHGGESFSQLVSRVGTWLDALDLPDAQPVSPATADASPRSRDIIAVTHAPLIRAAIVHALGAPAAVFARLEIAPLSVVELRHSPRRGWTWWPASPIAPTPAA